MFEPGDLVTNGEGFSFIFSSLDLEQEKTTSDSRISKVPAIVVAAEPEHVADLEGRIHKRQIVYLVTMSSLGWCGHADEASLRPGTPDYVKRMILELCMRPHTSL